MNGVKFYVGTSLANREAALRLIAALQALGGIVTYIWDRVDGSQYGVVAEKELAAVIEADIFICLLPGKLGTQAEVGAALAAKAMTPTKRVLLYAETEDVFTHADLENDVYPNIFWEHPFVERVIGVDAIAAVTKHLNLI